MMPPDVLPLLNQPFCAGRFLGILNTFTSCTSQIADSKRLFCCCIAAKLPFYVLCKIWGQTIGCHLHKTFMLMLLFQVGSARYALDTTSVVKVIPQVELAQYHGASPIVAGRFNYQGQIVPVLDLSQLLGNKPSQAMLSSRIILVNLGANQSRLLGLLVERVTETLTTDQVDQVERKEDSFLSQRPYLGDVLLKQQDMIQCLRVDQLLSEQVHNQLLIPLEVAAVTAEVAVEYE